MPPFSVPIEQIQTLGCELEVCGNRLDLYAVSDQDADPNRLKPLLTVLRNHKTAAVAWLQERTLVKTELERGIRTGPNTPWRLFTDAIEEVASYSARV